MVKYDYFKNILRMKQNELKDFCKKMLEYNDFETIDGDGYLYGKGEVPIMLVAHLDTVHTEIPSDLYFDSEQGIMWSPQGIGGDDRCGVYMILKLIKDYKPHVMFLEDEEIGCIGAGKMVEKLEKPQINFIIELDRRGRDDCVFYDCDNKDFKEYIKGFGFQEQQGTYSDICKISPEWDVASVNLSVGYKNEHTFSETINVNYMLETYQKVINILEDKETKYYDYQKKQYSYQYSIQDYQKKKSKRYHKGNYYDDYGYVNDDGEYIEWEELKSLYE